jgi:hypothetical protein
MTYCLKARWKETKERSEARLNYILLLLLVQIIQFDEFGCRFTIVIRNQVIVITLYLVTQLVRNFHTDNVSRRSNPVETTKYLKHKEEILELRGGVAKPSFMADS